MKPIEIYSLCSFIGNVAPSIKENKRIFRGHSSHDFPLKASIGRRDDYTIDIEKRLFLEFKKNYHSLTDHKPETDLEILFMAQHYGLPTRLLDWTFNPLIALYFATEPFNNKDGKVYSIELHKSFHVEELDYNSLAINDILRVDNCKYVVPHYTDRRYANQKSIFLLNNHPNWQFTFAEKETVYIIKNESKAQIRKDLALIGIDEPFVFPTLDNLSKKIVETIK
jgi:hypothetical protein